MTRMKFQQPITPEIHVPRKRKHSGKVHFSVDTPPSDIPRKKPRKQVTLHIVIIIHTTVYIRNVVIVIEKII